MRLTPRPRLAPEAMIAIGLVAAAGFVFVVWPQAANRAKRLAVMRDLEAYRYTGHRYADLVILLPPGERSTSIGAISTSFLAARPSFGSIVMNASACSCVSAMYSAS